MARGQSLQDPFLNALRKERVPVSIYLVNGIKLQGQIDSFDQFVVLLRNSVSQMVYKHAISTVVPARNVRLPTGEDGEVTEPAYRRMRGQWRVSGSALCNCLSALAAASAPFWSASASGTPSIRMIRPNLRRWPPPPARSRWALVLATRARPDPKYFVGSRQGRRNP